MAQGSAGRGSPVRSAGAVRALRCGARRDAGRSSGSASAVVSSKVFPGKGRLPRGPRIRLGSRPGATLLLLRCRRFWIAAHSPLWSQAANIQAVCGTVRSGTRGRGATACAVKRLSVEFFRKSGLNRLTLRYFESVFRSRRVRSFPQRFPTLRRGNRLRNRRNLGEKTRY
jgi:hypothetical protein